jgi:hypothetical protein
VSGHIVYHDRSGGMYWLVWPIAHLRGTTGKTMIGNVKPHHYSCSATDYRKFRINCYGIKLVGFCAKLGDLSIWGFLDDEDSDRGLLGCDAVQYCGRIPTWIWGQQVPRNIGILSQHCTASQRRCRLVFKPIPNIFKGVVVLDILLKFPVVFRRLKNITTTPPFVLQVIATTFLAVVHANHNFKTRNCLRAHLFLWVSWTSPQTT